MLAIKAEAVKDEVSCLYGLGIRKRATKSIAAPKGVRITMAKEPSVVTYALFRRPYKRFGNAAS